jgi:hypothetical protein
VSDVRPDGHEGQWVTRAETRTKLLASDGGSPAAHLRWWGRGAAKFPSAAFENDVDWVWACINERVPVVAPNAWRDIVAKTPCELVGLLDGLAANRFHWANSSKLIAGATPCARLLRSAGLHPADNDGPSATVSSTSANDRVSAGDRSVFGALLDHGHFVLCDALLVQYGAAALSPYRCPPPSCWYPHSPIPSVLIALEHDTQLATRISDTMPDEWFSARKWHRPWCKGLATLPELVPQALWDIYKRSRTVHPEAWRPAIVHAPLSVILHMACADSSRLRLSAVNTSTPIVAHALHDLYFENYPDGCNTNAMFPAPAVFHEAILSAIAQLEAGAARQVSYPKDVTYTLPLTLAPSMPNALIAITISYVVSTRSP